MIFNNLSDLPKTWIFDIDGTLVFHQKNYLNYNDTLLPGVKDFFKLVIKDCDTVILMTARKKGKFKLKWFLWRNNIRYDHIIFGLPVGERILFNDIKPFDNLNTAYAINLERNKGFIDL